MKLVIQRVAHASVTVAGDVVGRISQGLVILLGIEQGDRMEQVSQLATKVLKLRLWPDLKDPSKQWASSVVDNKYGLLVVSQFTLFATFKKPKPDFHRAMGGADAEKLYEAFVAECRKGLPDPSLVATGSFGAMMDVDLRNDGPVTVELVAEASSDAGEGSKGGGGGQEKAGVKQQAKETGGNAKSTGDVGKSSASGRAATGVASSAAGDLPGEFAVRGERPDAIAAVGGGNNICSVGARENELLAVQPYLAGFLPGHIDAEVFGRVQGIVPAGLPHAARWSQHIASFTTTERTSWP